MSNDFCHRPSARLFLRQYALQRHIIVTTRILKDENFGEKEGGNIDGPANEARALFKEIRDRAGSENFDGAIHTLLI